MSDCLPEPSLASHYYAALPVVHQHRLIRVLDLECPSRVSRGAPLVGRLRMVSLDHNPRFAALSYVWGVEDALRSEVICLDWETGSKFHIGITLNCDAALRDLRQSFGSMTIWVDAICINQNDSHERSQQVLLMQEIYTRADPVYAHLGTDRSRSRRTIERLIVAAETRKDAFMLGYFLKPPGWRRSIYRIQYFVILILRDIWAAMTFGIFRGRLTLGNIWKELVLDSRDLSDFLSNDWIHRVWTFQEAILPLRLVLVCGSAAIHWDRFICATHALKVHSSKIGRQSTDQIKGFQTWDSLIGVWLSYPRYMHGEDQDCIQRVGLQERIRLNSASWIGTIFQRQIATLIVEILFIYTANRFILPLAIDNLFWSFVYGFIIYGSIMALVDIMLDINKDAHIGPRKPEEFDTKSDHEVVHGILRAIRERKASDSRDRSYALYGILPSMGISLSPSDYRKKEAIVYEELFYDLLQWRPSSLNLLIDAGRREAGMPSWVPDFDASDAWLDQSYIYGTNLHSTTRNSSPIFQFDGRQLTVSGQSHGWVTFCSHLHETTGLNYPADWCARHNLVALAQWIMEVRRLAIQLPSYQSLSAAVYCTLNWVLEPGMEADMRIFNDFYQCLVKVATTNTSKLGNGPNSALQAYEQLSASSTALSCFECICKKLTGKRNLFVTSAGFIGSGPVGMHEGDVVTLISGVSIPMIFRMMQSSPPAYVVVGPAYIYGFMRGEEWGMYNEENFTLI